MSADFSADPWGPNYPIDHSEITHRRFGERLQQEEFNWNGFPELPGTHIRRKRMGHRGEFELVTDDQRVLGTLREGSPWPGQMLLRSVTIDGRRFHMTPAKRRATTDLALVDDATGSVVLRVFGRHHAGEAKAEIQLASGTRLRFPMLGGGPKLAVMTAVDQTGKRLLRFRQGKRLSLQTRTAARIEVVVNPAVALITDLVLVIAVASGFILTEHRSKPGGGGG